MTAARPMFRDKPLPLLLTADGGIDDLCAWAVGNRDVMAAWLNQAGVVLLRGFGLSTPAQFRAACAAISPDLRNYVGGDSPRQNVDDQVYTSTEYPAASEVLLHNELSYAGWSPDRVFFGCMVAPATGGQTHVADGRQICADLDPEVRGRFAEKGVTYLQHLWDADGAPGPGKSWQETFETTDREAVEDYLRASNMRFEWTGLGLRTAATHPAILTHPATGEACWHNQADQWHRNIASVKDTVPGSPDAAKGDTTAGTESLGNHVTFGDGSEIAVDDLMHVRAVSKTCEVLFDWQPGDLMVIDNIMAMHGRKPFTGKRRVLVAMA